MECVVYVLRSLNKDFKYTGMTNNIEKRLKEHNLGNNKSTKYYAPFEIIYTETHKNSIEARKREKFLKSGQGRKRIKEQGL